MLFTRLLAAAGIGVATVGVPAQTQTVATEIYLAARFATEYPAGGGIGRWTNISSNAGYDNQPSFLPDNSGLLFTSMRDGKQTDIYRYTIATKTIAQVAVTNITRLAVSPDGKWLAFVAEPAAR